MAKGKGPESGEKKGKRKGHGGFDDLRDLLASKEGNENPKSSKTSRNSRIQAEEVLQQKTATRRNGGESGSKREASQPISEGDEDVFSFEARKPSSDFIRWFKKFVPNRPDEWFDKHIIPRETLFAFREVGPGRIHPYERADGVHCVDILEGGKKYTLTHSELLLWLRAVVSAYEADAGDPTEISKAQKGETQQVLPSVDVPAPSMAHDQEVYFGDDGGGGDLFTKTVYGEKPEPEEFVDISSKPAYFGDPYGGGGLYSSASGFEHTKIAVPELTDDLIGRVLEFEQRFPHLQVKEVGEGRFRIYDTRANRSVQTVDVSEQQLLDFMSRQEQVVEGTEKSPNEVDGYPGLLAQVREYFPDAHTTDHTLVTYTDNSGNEVACFPQDAMLTIIERRHPNLSPEDKEGLLMAWDAEFQRKNQTELTIDVDGSRVELQKHLERIRAQFPDAELSPDGKLVTMTVGTHQVTMEVAVALENAERKEREGSLEAKEVPTIEEICDRYLRYQDAPMSEEERRKQFEPGRHDASRVKYATALQEMMRQRSPDIIVSNAEYLQAELLSILGRIGISPTPYGMSVTWAMWDMGKQYHFFTHQEEADPKYSIGNPLESSEKRHEILCRHLGWEFHAAYYFKRLPQNLLDLIESHPDIKAIITKEVKQENSSLSSFDLAELGRKLYGIYQGGGTGGEPPVPPDVPGGGEGEPPLNLEQAKQRLEAVRRDIAELRKADADVAYTTTYLIEKYPGLKAAFGGKKILGAYRGGDDGAALMWVRNRITELKEEEKRLEGGLGDSFDTRFNTKFGITKEEINALPGYTDLSEGQRVLLYENLNDFSERGDGFLGAVWTGVTSRFGIRGEAIPRKGTRGMKAYQNQLTLMIQGMKELHVRVHAEGGRAVPDFVGIELSRRFRPEQKEVLDELNRQAHAFARIPSSWQEDGNGTHKTEIEDKKDGALKYGESKVTRFFKEKIFRSERRQHYTEYEDAHHTYEEAKQKFAEVMEQTGHSPEDIVRALITVDANVHAMRFTETNPEAVALLKEATDRQTAETIGSKVMSAGIYAGLGLIGRRALAETAGRITGPAVAMAVEASKKWNERAAQFREDHRHQLLEAPDARTKRMNTSEYVKLRSQLVQLSKNDPRGESKEYQKVVKAIHAIENKDTSLNVVNASGTITPEGRQVKKGLTKKLEEAVEEYMEYKDSTDVIRRGGFVNNNGVAVPEITKMRRDVAIEHLKGIITYAEDKLRLNRIHFGKKEDHACNRAQFFEAYTKAHILLATERLAGQGEGTVVSRLEQYLARQESNIDARRKKAQARAMIHRDIVAAGTFGSIGVILQETGAADWAVDKTKEAWNAGATVLEKLGEASKPNLSYPDTPVPYRDVDAWAGGGGKPPAVPEELETVLPPKPPDPVGLVAGVPEEAPRAPEAISEEVKPAPGAQQGVGVVEDPRGVGRAGGEGSRTAPAPSGAPLGPDAVRIAPGLEGGGIPAKDWSGVKGRYVSEVLKAAETPNKLVLRGVSLNVTSGLAEIIQNEGVRELVPPVQGETVEQFMKRLTQELANKPPGWPLPPQLDEILKKYPFLKVSLSTAYESGTIPQAPVPVEVPVPPRLTEIVPDIKVPLPMQYVADHPLVGKMNINFDEDMSQADKIASVTVNGEPLKIVRIEEVKGKDGIGGYTRYTLQGERPTDTHVIVKPTMWARMGGTRVEYIKNGVSMLLSRANPSDKMP